MKEITPTVLKEFQDKIYDFYHANKRDFAWRSDISPYNVVVSEIMLQQTQTHRVISKFDQWITLFPDFTTLAKASDLAVLAAWQGLGYNRRGLALKKIAQIIINEHAGILPNDPKVLQTFPQIGPNTAGSICAFAFNKPIAFIETNIRTVFTHEFFAHQEKVDDQDILPLIQATIPASDPRNWYYALMDYGVYLKKEHGSINAKNKNYAKQSKFEGSTRQVRGFIIKVLTTQGYIDQNDLLELIALQLPGNKHNANKILSDLKEENIIKQKNSILFL